MDQKSEEEKHEVLKIESSVWNQMERNLKQLGFREGASSGRESSFQAGFDIGYVNGLEMGEKLGLISGFSCYVKQCDKSLPQAISESESSLFQHPAKGSCCLCNDNSKPKASLSEDIYSQSLKDLVAMQGRANDSVTEKLQAISSKIGMPSELREKFLI